jgi:sulfur-carrier protein adenylyltransferase/sulfurtransferase
MNRKRLSSKKAVKVPMPDVPTSDLLTNFAQKVASTWPTAEVITPNALRARFPNRVFTHGWEIRGPTIGLPESVILSIDADFPYSLPRIALSAAPDLCSLPHVESDGVFCLTPSTAAASVPVGIGHALELMGAASEVYRLGKAGTNQTDFIKEFGTYWELGQRNIERVELWLPDLTQTRIVEFTRSKNQIFVADSQEALRTWMKYRQLPVKQTAAALHVRLPEPLYPHDYPDTSAELADLIETAGPEAIRLFGQVIKPLSRLVVVFTFTHEGRTISFMAFVEITNSVPTSKRHGQQFIAKSGRRQVGGTHILSRFKIAQFPVHRCRATRADSEYLVARTTGAISSQVRSVRVAIIGCGALGATIAQTLAQAGISKLTLLDAEVFNVENIGRHVLDASYIGRLKAEALKDDLQGRFCDASVAAIPKTWQRAFAEDPEILGDCDLIISATGDWLSDAHLNVIARQASIPVVFGWLERFALAGHGVFIPPGGACFQCMKSAHGEFSFQVSRIGGELPTDASCGAQFQPFSAFASNQVASMVTKLVLDAVAGRVTEAHLRTWVAGQDDFDHAEASIDPKWRDTLFANFGFERVHRRPIPPSDQCPLSPHH